MGREGVITLGILGTLDTLGTSSLVTNVLID